MTDIDDADDDDDVDTDIYLPDVKGWIDTTAYDW